MLIRFVLRLFFTFMGIKVAPGVSFGLLLASILIIYLFIKFFIGMGGSNDD